MELAQDAPQRQKPRPPPSASTTKAAEVLPQATGSLMEAAVEYPSTPRRSERDNSSAKALMAGQPLESTPERQAARAPVAAVKNQDIVPVDMKPLLSPARATGRRRRDRDLALKEMPLEDAPAASEEPEQRRRPKRRCLAPLEAWRNERIMYERLPGSRAPSVAGVVLNLATRQDGQASEEAIDDTVLEEGVEDIVLAEAAEEAAEDDVSEEAAEDAV